MVDWRLRQQFQRAVGDGGVGMVWSSSCSLTLGVHAHATRQPRPPWARAEARHCRRRRHRAGHRRSGDGFGVFGELPRPARIQARCCAVAPGTSAPAATARRRHRTRRPPSRRPAGACRPSAGPRRYRPGPPVSSARPAPAWAGAPRRTAPALGDAPDLRALAVMLVAVDEGAMRLRVTIACVSVWVMGTPGSG